MLQFLRLNESNAAKVGDLHSEEIRNPDAVAWVMYQEHYDKTP